MTYEEKLQKIVGKLKDERDLTRKGHKTKVDFDDRSFTKVRIGDIGKILLQFQDDEKILEIIEGYKVIGEENYGKITDDDYEQAEFLTVELGEEFDDWYQNYLILQKSKPENLEWISLLKVLDVCSDIDQQLQITGKTTIVIPSFPYPYIGRFLELFPYDSVGTRKSYQQHRWEGAQYLLRQGITTDVRGQTNDVLGYGNIVIKIDLVKFNDFHKTIKDEFSKRKKSFDEEKKSETITKTHKTTKKEAVWPDDFRWEGKDFVFGEYGSIDFKSKDRKFIFKTLTDKKGGWATIRELKGEKDAGYVRSTIKQIKDRFPEKVKRHVTIISTQDDNSEERPGVGAYRIKTLP